MGCPGPWMHSMRKWTALNPTSETLLLEKERARMAPQPRRAGKRLPKSIFRQP